VCDVNPVKDLILNLRRNYLIRFVESCDHIVCDTVSSMARLDLNTLMHVFTCELCPCAEYSITLKVSTVNTKSVITESAAL